MNEDVCAPARARREVRAAGDRGEVYRGREGWEE